MWCFDWLRQLSIDEWLNEWLNDEWLWFMADRINTIAHHNLDSLERNMSALREYNTLWKLAHREFKTSWNSLQDFRKSKWVTKGLWRFLPIVSSPLEVRRLRPRLYSLTPKSFVILQQNIFCQNHNTFRSKWNLQIPNLRGFILFLG